MGERKTLMWALSIILVLAMVYKGVATFVGPENTQALVKAMIGMFSS